MRKVHAKRTRPVDDLRAAPKRRLSEDLLCVWLKLHTMGESDTAADLAVVIDRVRCMEKAAAADGKKLARAA